MGLAGYMCHVADMPDFLHKAREFTRRVALC
jgi:hypothetical protein